MSPFNRYAKEYDLWYEKNKYIYHSELSAIRFLMPKRKKGLEVGVGTGRFAGPLGIKYGVEPSENMSVIARKKGIKVLNGTAEKMYTAKEIIDILEPAGFHKFTVTQTIFDKSNRFHEFRPGYGEGLFVAIKAMKNSKGGTKE